MAHIVWDWNGTLFDDISAVVAATNEIFDGYDVDPLTVRSFRAAFTRPIWASYERLLGRPLADGEWERLDASFHESYHRLMAGCALAAGALDTLGALATAGHGQSLLSMWRHERLGPTAERFGIARFFARIDGARDGASGGSKFGLLVAHLEALGTAPDQVVMVGDCVDDALAAQRVGARAVLYAGGMQDRAALERIGVPVVDRLADVGDRIC
jgi:phosphoglycolate phosphatase-like HAD superfamily hydrolase